MTPDSPEHDIRVALLTGGSDRPYALGLSLSLAADHVSLDFVGSDQLDCPELRDSPGLTFLNLRGDQRVDASAAQKVTRILVYYARLVRYAWPPSPRYFISFGTTSSSTWISNTTHGLL